MSPALPRGAPVGRTPSSLLASRASSWLLALVIALVSLPLLAVAPHHGDGAELIHAAEHGGVLHPPGFPLQAWLNRLFIHLPLPSSATRLALLSLLGHAGAVFALAEALRAARVRFLPRLAGVAAFACFPAAWHLGVVPEVFALAHFFIALLLWQVVSLAQRPPAERSTTDSLLLGALVGLAAAQHPITLTSAPLFLTSATLLLREREGRGRRFAAMALAFVLVVVPAYASLPLLRTASPWPDWGHLDSAADILRHVLRVEYGVAAMSAVEVDEGRRGLALFVREALSFWHVGVALVGVGVFACVRRQPLAARVAVLGFSCTALALLYRANLPGSAAFVDGVLERLTAPAALAGAFLLSLGIDHVSRSRVPSLVVSLTSVAFTLGMLRLFPYADVSDDRGHTLLMEAIALSLPDDAVYVTRSDDDICGFPTPDGGRRVPIAGGLLELDWYADVVPVLEPRLSKASRGAAGDIKRVIRVAYDAGLPVAALHDAVLREAAVPVTYRGVLAVAMRDDPGGVSPETVISTARLCPVVSQLGALPPDGHRLARHMRRPFVRAFEASASFLEQDGQRELGAVAGAIASALADGTDAERWRTGCAQFVRAFE